MSVKYALVTGGSRGIGRAVCIKLAAMGLPVLVGYRSGEKEALEVCKQIVQNGGSAEPISFDVCDKEKVEMALQGWETKHPDDYIAYLVNNAGINHDNLMFMMTDEEWSSVISTSLNGLFFVTRYLLPKMMARGHGGRIVNMSSLSGLKGMAGQANYCAAKSVLRQIRCT